MDMGVDKCLHVDAIFLQRKVWVISYYKYLDCTHTCNKMICKCTQMSPYPHTWVYLAVIATVLGDNIVVGKKEENKINN